MNIRAYLEILAQKIKTVYPKLPEKKPSDYKEMVQKSIIEDIQARLAEIYAIIERETANEDLDLDYAAGIKKFPERLNSILSLISILALSIKTKLKINETEKVFDNTFIQNIDSVCLDCFRIKSVLSGTQDSSAIENYNKGLITTCQYQDYRTGFGKQLSPGFNKGQLRDLVFAHLKSRETIWL